LWEFLILAVVLLARILATLMPDRHLAAGAILPFGGLGVLVADVVTAALV
jgi:hypothetical protein